ncbi:MAG: TetR/AcrR family transcriptional regulator [Gemmatimonadales bacterium]|nr:TetR/AcrR family transcriptional regulator [Gemmatimonadales bacterium]
MSDQNSGTEAWRALRPEKRDKIFSVAVDEFSKGYNSASMNSLAKSAGISKGSIFNYFRSKGDLFEGVVSVTLTQVKKYLRGVQEQTSELSFEDRLCELLRSGFRFIDRHPRLASIYFNLLQSGDVPFRSRQIAAITRSSTNYLNKLIEEGQAAGELNREINSRRLAFLLNAMLERILSSYYTEHLARDIDLYRADRSTQEEWIELFGDLVRGRISGGREKQNKDGVGDGQ